MNRVSRFILLLLLGPLGVALHAWVPGIVSLANPAPTAVEASADDTVQVVVSAHLVPQAAIRTHGESSTQTWSERLKPQLLSWNSPGVDSRPLVVGEFVEILAATAVAPTLQLQKVRWQI